MNVAAPAPLSFRQVLAIDVMRRVWYAQVISLLGDFLALFAVISAVSFRLHGTPAQVTGVQIAYMLPLAVLGPVAGVFVDRWALKPTLVGSDLIRAGLVLLLMISTTLWQVYAILVAVSSVSSFFAPAQSVTIRQHVPREGLLSANSLMQMAMMGIRIVGPAAAGALVASFGARLCYGLDGLSFVGSAALIGSTTFIAAPRASQAAGPSANSRIHQIWIDMGQGLRFIAHHPSISFVVLAMAAGLFTLGCFGPLIAIFVRESLHAGAGSFGAVSAMIGIGLFAGTQVLRTLGRRMSNEAMVLSGLAGIGAGVLLLGALPFIAATLASTFLIGFAFAGIIVPAQTLLQQETPHELMGRVSSTVMSTVFFAQVLGLVLSGILGQLLGIRAVFFLCAALAAALAASGHFFLAAGHARDTRHQA
ncbi:MAG: MFS transporter [Acidobacteria bacterium RIFCSPLOWO2_02_FULL_67_36]|nr:MAG: MFS transporter [Acidobacteria bacterium RIFCSPLOWO2_02_FULL_67_36]OFW22295.1 MAG: MFS transporter [Acidobacteria bacterium RIFCSPLOWO2_12_FULL_66_21]